MIVALITTLALGSEPAALDLAVEPLALAPRGVPMQPARRPVQVATLDRDLVIDGRFETIWRSVPQVHDLRSLLHERPVDPSWRLAVAATPRGLGIALRGVPVDGRVDLAIDPDGSRRGWIRLRLQDGDASQADCRADPSDADGMPVFHKWTVRSWDCAPARPATAAHGPDGWELLVPWPSLEPTTDDLRLQGWIRTQSATATLDAAGRAREYAAPGRSIVLLDRPSRSESVSVRPDRVSGLTLMTLTARGLTGTEAWSWTASANGRTLATGLVDLSPSARGVASATVEVPVADVDGVAFTAHRASDEPLRPGGWTYPWSDPRRASLATPIHREHIEVRTWLLIADDPVPVEIRAPGGPVLARAAVALPRGTARVWIIRDPTWPEHVQVRVGDLFLEGWRDTLFRGRTP